MDTFQTQAQQNTQIPCQITHRPPWVWMITEEGETRIKINVRLKPHFSRRYIKDQRSDFPFLFLHVQGFYTLSLSLSFLPTTSPLWLEILAPHCPLPIRKMGSVAPGSVAVLAEDKVMVKSSTLDTRYLWQSLLATFTSIHSPLSP